ncbi:hypothetical protein GQ43DRAFT_365222 [Delitschia confertaspora ATCC 74209]|uniref:Heterokaryon incompatibility domain-containing protein n=1 Tax=Delitschia confertaspora ATCC 74209 TaxID=1513339 RepID=A0A9P4MUY8_9PLEO|nr:hypothetical protein GQ43DRAFT_365222 [Delitschia confertaspora ATCC 74209]
MPGDFPSAPDTVAPDDSRSETGQPALGRRRWSETPASIKHSGSISRLGSFRSSSSGVLGDKVYRYTELQEMEFRLVRILPAKMSTIKCEIIHASLKNPPHYLAISYAWGDAGDTRKIQLEGTGISVAVSLYGALEVLRKKREAVLVWVDALCIDQQNRDERTQQVQLMTSIYSKADSVVVWLGPDADDSQLASQLLADVASKANIQSNISSIISSGMGKAGFAAVVALFERDYWKRLWVVQEVFNGKNIMVYCGSSNLPWDTYKAASQVFWSHKGALDHYFPGGSYHGNGGLTYSQVLAYQGPGSLPDIHSLRELGEESLLAVMRACRRKLSADARDKVFGILGLLPAEIRNEFPVDYSLSTREVYINVVDFLLSTTERLDIICESIHFPIHTSSVNLPSWVPDWSHIPETPALCNSYDFSAAGKTKANYRFLDERRNKLEISAIYLDTISAHGISVGTLCTLADYLMAFLHWRALLLAADIEVDPNLYRIEEAFAATLCLDQVPTKYNRWSDWLTACYHVFASLIVERLPRLPIDSDLRQYAKARVEIEPHQRRQFLQDHFGSKMMGRCFCLTNNGLMGMGSGFMAAGDVVVVPLGCSTPILLRPEGSKGEYRFVGDVYINGYMQSNAIEQWRRKKREVGEFVIH